MIRAMNTEQAADTSDHSPRMAARRQAMIDAAAAIFFEHGFERASLSAIVARSGGSLSTLYQLFGSKEGLFEAMMTQRCGEIMEPLSAPDLSALCPRETLSRIAHGLLDVLMDTEAQGLWRMVMGEGIKFPGLAEIYFRCGPDMLLSALRKYLTCLHEHGAVYCPDAMAGAQSFCMMVHGEQFFRIVTGLRPTLDEGERERHVQTMVEMFMRMVAVG